MSKSIIFRTITTITLILLLAAIPVSTSGVLACAPIGSGFVTLPANYGLHVANRTVSVKRFDQVDLPPQVVSIPGTKEQDRVISLRSTYSGDWRQVRAEALLKNSAIGDWATFGGLILVKDSVKPLKGEVKFASENELDHFKLAEKAGVQPQGLNQADRQFLSNLGLTSRMLRRSGFTHVAYKVRPRRLDTLVIDSAGKLGLICGQPTELAPEPPPLPSGCAALCNIYVPPGNLPVTTADIVPIGPKEAVDGQLTQHNQQALARTLKKLEAGQPVNIVFWGDSITVGGFATEPKFSFVEQFLKMLKGKYPKSQIGFHVAGVSGSNTSMRLASFQKDVLALKPDLVAVEFVNDFMLPEDVVAANYKSIVSQLKTAGIDVLICTPHLPSPGYVHMESEDAIANSYFPTFLRKIARDENCAIADVSRRWAHLAREGLQPTRLLSDAVIHPNNYGHTVYASELLCALTGERAI